jgi:hypothetical protein
VHHDQGGKRELTKGSRWPELQRREETDDDRRRMGQVLAGRGDAEVAGPSGWRE